jgi:hypothetical protein
MLREEGQRRIQTCPTLEESIMIERREIAQGTGRETVVARARGLTTQAVHILMDV